MKDHVSVKDVMTAIDQWVRSRIAGSELSNVGPSLRRHAEVLKQNISALLGEGGKPSRADDSVNSSRETSGD